MDFNAFLASLPTAGEVLNRRQSVVRDIVRGVSRGYYPGLYLYGPPGTGKTYTVLRTLAAGKRAVVYRKGHITPIGLVELLRVHDDAVIVLDDVAEVFSAPTALQIFLAALGRSPEDGEVPGMPNARVITYKRKGVEERIVFTGGLIAISNLELHGSALLEAIKSRADSIRYAPSDQELAALMLDIAAKGYELQRPKVAGGGGRTTLPPETCREVALFVIEESLRRSSRLDLRVLVDKSFPKRLQHDNGDADNDWKDLVLAGLEEQVNEPRHTPLAVPAPRPRQEQDVVRQLLASDLSHAEQLAQWNARTGLSPRAFYRWQARINGRR